MDKLFIVQVTIKSCRKQVTGEVGILYQFQTENVLGSKNDNCLIKMFLCRIIDVHLKIKEQSKIYRIKLNKLADKKCGIDYKTA
ncbi:hypothetical protein C7B70_13120 [Chlorogloea sp. CCALA 695]|nr:hypothetical protein C7B70_13120 [Chlorogloea sp. CCALA 695]